MTRIPAKSWASLLFLLVAPALAAAPSDPYFFLQWALSNDGSQAQAIAVEDRVDLLHTVLQRGTPGVDVGWSDVRETVAARAAAPVTVAVLDFGIDLNHPDLAGRIAKDGFDFLSKPILGISIPRDTDGHGTHVSGIIAANADNGIGIAGVAPKTVQILPLRILSDGFKNFAYPDPNSPDPRTPNMKLISEYTADAIRYAVEHGATVLNLSLEGWPRVVDTPRVRATIREAVQRGVLIVAAAANEHKRTTTYPCNYTGVLCVGAISNTGAPSVYSNYDGSVDLLAPGDGIISTYPTDFESGNLRVHGYETMSGTSQATPYVAGIAAALKSVFPGITLDELRARLFASAIETPGGAALYGRVNLKRALEAQPQPVYLPDFKGQLEFPIDEKTLTIDGNLKIKNLWATAKDFRAELSVNGKPAGKLELPTMAQGQLSALVWKYTFASLDEGAELTLKLKISDASGASKEFTSQVSAVRPMGGVAKTQVVLGPPLAQPAPGQPRDWVMSSGGSGAAFSSLRAVDSYAPGTELPKYFQQFTAGPAGALIQLVDSARSGTDVARVVQIPGIQQITQILRMDQNSDGKRDWVVLGLGQFKGQQSFVFYFLDGDLKPLYGSVPASTWRISPQVDAVTTARGYSSPGSWVKLGNQLVPCFLAQGGLPAGDGFSGIDFRRLGGSLHPERNAHLYYLKPQALVPEEGVPLQLRAFDNADFQRKNPKVFLLNPLLSSSLESQQGHLRILASTHEGLAGDAPMLLLDLRSLTDFSITPAPGWDPLSAGGVTFRALTADASEFLPFYLSLFGGESGSLAWSSPQGALLGRSEFEYRRPSDPVTGLIGAFDLGARGHFWFLRTGFQVAAFHEGPGQPLENRSISIERVASFSEDQFSSMFGPALVGTASEPVPGVYIDQTLVRDTHVGVATWNSATGKFEKVLRYSIQIPPLCAQMDPVHLGPTPESFAFPVLCPQSGRNQLRLVQPET